MAALFSAVANARVEPENMISRNNIKIFFIMLYSFFISVSSGKYTTRPAILQDNF
jgi:hypothetical protein